MRLLRPLAVRSVALLWGGLSLSAIGDQLYAVALVWVAVGVFGPAAGYFSALQALCGVSAALLVGRWADSWDQRRAMAGADVARAAILLALVGWWLVRGGPPGAGLVAAIIVLAAGEAVFRPAMSAVLPALLPRERLPAANALFDTTDRSARLLGPGLVGILAASLPVVHFFTLDAATFLLSATAVLTIAAPVVRLAATERPTLLGSLRRGYAALRGHRLLYSAFWSSACVNGPWYVAFYLAVPLVIEQAGITGPGGTGLGAYGLTISAYGATNLLATLVVGSREVPAHPGRQMFGGTTIVGVAVAAMGLAAMAGWGLWALLAGAAIAAVGGPAKDIPVAVLRQTELPPGAIPASLRLAMAANSTSMLLGMLVAPVIARLVGPAVLLLLCGVAIATAAAVAMARHWADASRATIPERSLPP